MATISVDTSTLEGAEFLSLDDEAAVALWLRALCYAKRLGTNGYVPAVALKILSFSAHPAETAQKLVSVGIWEVAPGGFRFVVGGAPAALVVDAVPLVSEARREAARVAGIRSGEARRSKRLPLARLGSWSKQAYPAVFARDGRACRYCRAGERLTVDHLVPRCQGGGDEVTNLVVACRSCNSRKSGRTPEQAGMALLPLPEVQ